MPDAGPRRTEREDLRRLAQERLPPGLKLPQGYRLRAGPIVVCPARSRQWRVPDGQVVKLSENAWRMLLEHARSHEVSTAPAAASRSAVPANVRRCSACGHVESQHRAGGVPSVDRCQSERCGCYVFAAYRERPT